MEILLSKNAIKFLKKQEQNVRNRMQTALIGLLEIPPRGDLKKLKGMENTYRLRVGTYRIVYTIDYQKEVVQILAIDNRGDIY